MLFPIGDDNIKGGHFPLFSYGFIVLNILIFLYEVSLGTHLDQFIYDFGAIPKEVSEGQRTFTLLTSMFLHGSLMHLLGNMVFLWIFADNIEATVGNGRFFLFYMLGGLAAHLGHILIDPSSMIPTVGASGAIAAVMGAYMVMFPRSRVRVLFVIFPFYVSAWIFLGLWLYFQLESGVTTLQFVGDEQGGGVAYWAHIGGFAFGVLAGFFFRSQGHWQRRVV